MLSAQFRYMVHPARNIDEPARVFHNDPQMLTLRIVDLTAAAVEDHTSIPPYRRQRRPQVMREGHLNRPPYFDQSGEMGPFFQNFGKICFRPCCPISSTR